MNAFTSLFLASDQDLSARLKSLVRRTAPQWPLPSFVAVNPFMAMGSTDFATAAVAIARTRGAQLVPDANLPQALPTLADVAGEAIHKPLAAFITERISQWAAGFYDQGQAMWAHPWRDLAPFAAWREEAMIDRTPDIWGLAGFRQQVKALPKDPIAAAEQLLQSLNLPEAAESLYLERLIGTVAGWAALLRHRDWEASFDGDDDDGVRDLLVIRLAWDVLAAKTLIDDAAVAAWRVAISAPSLADAPDLTPLESQEARWRDTLLAALAKPSPEAPAPAVQAVFCIDVRSELLRNALEQADPAIETLGFAGFFGLPIDVQDAYGQRHAACPPLLRPKALVCEALPDKPGALRPFLNAAEALKRSGASAFGYVESFGLTATGALLSNLAGQKTSTPRDTSVSVAASVRAQAEMAAGLLKGTGLTTTRAPLVVLVGHEGQSRNNPHAAGLHCGACGGQSGAVNARAAAMMLNNPEVRALLKVEKGISIADTTWFAAAVHNTTTDELRLLDADLIPPAFAREATAFAKAAIAAGEMTRQLRAPTLKEKATLTMFKARASDPSQVRPEWGLAGCAGFIAAPRHLTRGKALGGRVFLHSYDWRTDEGFAVLEQILTAPVIVASWINLQYFASSAAPEVFGAGNKVLHNVVGGQLGVLEGNGGDLRLGLPLQSVSDGQALRHEPLRLSVMVAAPTTAIDSVLSKHAGVRDLVENRWLHLFAMDDDDRVCQQRTATGWQALPA